MFIINKATVADIKNIQDFLEKSFHDTYDKMMGVEETQKIIELNHKDEILDLQINNEKYEVLIIRKSDIDQLDIIDSSNEILSLDILDNSENTKKIKKNLKDKKIIAYAITTIEKPREVTLQGIYVDKEYQRQGIGRQLLLEIIKKNTESRIVNIELFSDNLKAIVFYKQQGFIDCSQMDKINTKDENNSIKKLIKFL